MPITNQNQAFVRGLKSSSVTYIYALQDLTTNSVFYVGKSNNPTKRLMWKYHPDVQARLKSSICTQVILEEVHAKNGTICTNDWLPREEFWIQYYKQAGACLLNKNNGGGGVSHHTPETCAKVSAALKGRPASDKVRLTAKAVGKANAGAKRPTMGAIMRQKLKGKPKPPMSETHRKNLRAAQQLRWTPEARKARSESQKAMWQNSFYQEHMSEVHRGPHES